MPKAPSGDRSKSKINVEDDGGVEIMVVCDEDRVFIAFGEKVAWIALDRDELAGFINLLSKHLAELVKADGGRLV